MKKWLKRYITTFFVTAFLLCLPISAGADSTGVCFTSTDDTLLELPLSPVYYSGIPYVSARVFAYFGIYYSYFPSELTAQLYNSSKLVLFNMDAGNAYNANMEEYQASAVYRNGVTYVPVEWTCNYFGLSCSYISGKGYGDILRLKSGSEVLSDSLFLNAATTLMQCRYNEYYGYSENTEPPATETPKAPIKKRSAVITLSFIGLPSGKLLDTFDRYGLSGCFFLTAEDAKNDPDTVRRIAGSGHSIGIYSSGTPSEDITAASDAVFLAAQFVPTIVSSPSSTETECKEYAESNALAYFNADYYITPGVSSFNDIETRLDLTQNSGSLCFSSAENSVELLTSVLQYLTANKFFVMALRETSI